MVARGRYKRSLPPQLFVNDRCPWVGGLEEPAPREPVALQPQSQAKWPIDWPGQQVCQALGFVAPPPALPPAVPGGVSPDKKQTCLAALLFDVAVGCAVHYSQWAGRAALLICHSDDPPPPPPELLSSCSSSVPLVWDFFSRRSCRSEVPSCPPSPLCLAWRRPGFRSEDHHLLLLLLLPLWLGGKYPPGSFLSMCSGKLDREGRDNRKAALSLV